MKIAARGQTDVGRKRDQNEDSFFVDGELGLFVVADGMGGHAGGATASKMAVQAIETRMRAAREATPELFTPSGSLEESTIPEILREAVESACQAIFQTAQGDAALAGMGTTVTAVAVAGPKAFVAHVGDSRCYLARRDRIYQVTEDHSLVNEQLKAGAITPDEARHSRFRNIITRSVGFESDVAVDLMGIDLEAGDRIVVCCDGLSNMVEDSEILEIVSTVPLESSPKALIELANERGGDDNVTVVVIHAQ
jgi:protein phosphatase